MGGYYVPPVKREAHRSGKVNTPLGNDRGKTWEREVHLKNEMGHNTPLPGAIDPEDLIAAPPHQTKCQVCQSRPATLKSRDGQVWICDVCQRIILRARAREMGVRP